MTKQPCDVLGCKKRHCACGCQRHVTSKRKGAKWATVECIPSYIRSDAFAKWRKTFAYRTRAKKFRDVLNRLTASRRRISSEDLVAAFYDVYRRGYVAGFQTGRAAGEQGDTTALARAEMRGAA